MLLMNSFEHPDHFADHVNVVFQNATEANPPGSAPHIAAVELRAIFDQLYNKFLDEYYSEAAVAARQAQGEKKCLFFVLFVVLKDRDEAMTIQEIRQFNERVAHLMSVKKDISSTCESSYFHGLM